MYPVPPRPETQGSTERYIGTWIAQHRGAREKIVLATKIAGPARQPHNPRHIRGEGNQFDRKNLTEALNDSLKRLQTDYVDLYQLHWPDRSTMTFGRPALSVGRRRIYGADRRNAVGARRIRQGRQDSPYRRVERNALGCRAVFARGGKLGLPRIVSIQNPYSLLNRTYEVGLSEYAHRDNIGLLGVFAAGVRLAVGQSMKAARVRPVPASRCSSAFNATASRTRFRPPRAMWNWRNGMVCRPRSSRWPSSIAGRSDEQPDRRDVVDQLKENIASAEVKLSPEALAEIDKLHELQPNPAP